MATESFTKTSKLSKEGANNLLKLFEDCEKKQTNEEEQKVFTEIRKKNFRPLKEMRNDYDIYKYGVLSDKTIVKINSWTYCHCCEADEQELYFNYTSLFKKRKSAWAYKKDFIDFAMTKKGAKNIKKER